jgi:DNA (cytosine-5)-methyltransferase 1
MTDFVAKIEKSLKNIAIEYEPVGTDYRALIHQWLHSIAANTPLFAESRGVSKQELIKRLSETGLYKSESDFLEKLGKTIRIKPPVKPLFSFIDLFAGIGGMRLGFQEAGGVCVFSSEFEKNAQATYLQNYGELPFGDITKIPEDLIPEHDVLVAGFPCQPFSHAGLKLGVDDTRGTLFYDIARILEKKRPKAALLENVKGLISHDKGHTLQVVLKTLNSIGYRCNIDNDIIEHGSPKDIQTAAKNMVLKSYDFGVPQNRQRIYLVLWREELVTQFVYPEPLGIKTRLGDILEKNPDCKYTISDRLWDGHKRRKIENAANGKGFGFGLVNAESQYTNTISARYYKDGSEILIDQFSKNPRKVTPREAARIQGFPEEFLTNKSDMQAYKQLGNSVTVPVVRCVASNMLKQLIEI